MPSPFGTSPDFSQFNQHQLEPVAPDPAKVQLHYIRRYLQDGSLPANQEDIESFADIQRIGANLDPESETHQAVARSIAEHFSARKYEPFDTAPRARFIVSNLAGDEELDSLTSLMVARETEILINETLQGAPPEAAFVDERITPLRLTILQELTLRIGPGEIRPWATDMEDDELLKRVYNKIDPPDRMALMERYVDEIYEEWVNEFHHSIDFTRLLTSEKSKLGGAYYRPLSATNRDQLVDFTADTLESLQREKNYGIIPMVVHGKDIGLEWDVAVFPPLNQALEEYDRGAMADFLLLKPDPNRTEALLQSSTVTNKDGALRLSNGELVQTRYRLYNDGQISQGQRYLNLPNSFIERLSVVMGQRENTTTPADFYIRLRALFVAIACDARVPLTVTRERIGGTVAETFRGIARKTKRSEPFLDLILRRLQELRRVQHAPQSSGHPEDWPKPDRPRVGYVRKLAEGTKRRPTANEEAIEYFRKIGVEYPGLPDDKNFVRPKEVEGDLETLRRASFRRSSSTRRLLGSLAAHEEAAQMPGQDTVNEQ